MRLHLLDGTYELFRAHFSKRPPRTAPDGRDVKATVGVVSSLLRLLADEDEGVTHLAVAFDNPIESWRNERFPAYKDSSGVDPALLAQFDDVERAVAALGVVVWSMDRHEADDAMATAAVRWGGDGADGVEQTGGGLVDQIRILTPDKDLGQVVRGERIVQVDRLREKLYDEAGVVARLGVPPCSVPDYLALVGDTADGIPGLPGFGAKGAAAILTRYGHLEAIPDLALDWDVQVRGATRLAATLAERRDDALLYRELARLDLDVPLAERLDDLAWGGVPRDRFLAWCDEVGSDGLRDRPHRFA
ncbi:5'-3' exonuclease [Nitriliruptor alkaliphilus]|uniref:5'-3' exonuclease n=1 Tax=Nitriliruptor alkaliphilus TaxID=427918 RepID=UPI000698EA10|nr:5'-3' exonuclease H3TH domain-containing protein [Nitriliruptor alkaliphilus]